MPNRHSASKTANASLNATDVIKIRQQGAAGESPRQMAMLYGVSAETIRRILRWESWAWVVQPTAKTDADAEASLSRLLTQLDEPAAATTDESPEEIRRRLAAESPDDAAAAAAKARLEQLLKEQNNG